MAARDRHRRLRRGARGARQRGVARSAHDVVGGEGHLLRHRHGRRVRHLLCRRSECDDGRHPTKAATERARPDHPRPRHHRAVRRDARARQPRPRRQARRDPRLRRSVRRRQVRADADHHRARAQGRRPHRGVRGRSGFLQHLASAAASSGAGACCFSRARCSPRSRCARTSSFRCANISTSRRS